MSVAWWLEAACRGRPTDWWFPARGDAFAGRVAVNICARCPVRAMCLAAALEEELVVGAAPSGIRGGRTADQRQTLMADAVRLRPLEPAGRCTAL